MQLRKHGDRDSEVPESFREHFHLFLGFAFNYLSLIGGLFPFQCRVGFCCVEDASAVSLHMSPPCTPPPIRDLHLNAEVRVLESARRHREGTGHCAILKASLLTGSQNSALYFKLRRLGTGDLEKTLFLILYFLVSATLPTLAVGRLHP